MFSKTKNIIGQKLNKVPLFYTFLFYFLKLTSFLFYFKKYRSKLLFVVLNKDWILERICIEIKKEAPGSDLYYSLNAIPRSRAYFFVHYKKFLSSIIRNPSILLDKNFVFFTHNSGSFMPEKDLGRILNLAHGIFVMNSADRDLLLSFGVRKEKIDIVYAGADPEMFKILDSKSEKEKKTIGFCLRYERYPEYTGRKNHDLVIDLIKEVREHNVILLGKNWRSFERFKEIESLEYFTYIETEYENYCHYYNMMDIFLSISKLEGGPVPLIEAMFCGVFPIVTKTGFAPDLINERNGILLPIDSKRDDILKTIYSAKLISREEVRMSVDKLTWSNFGKKIVSTIENSLLN